MTDVTASLTVLRCSHGTYAVCIDGEDGGGTRVTPDKCCGRWEAVVSWALSREQWEELRDSADCAAKGDLV